MKISQKKIVKCLLIMFMLFQYYTIYGYNTEKIYLKCNKDLVEIGEEFEVTLNLENEEIVAFTSYLYFDETKVQYISGPENTNLIENHINYVWYDITGGKSPKQGELAKFKFKAKEKGIANFIIQGEFYNSKEEMVQKEFEGTQIKIGREEVILEKEITGDVKKDITQDVNFENTNLETLAIENELLYPAFDTNITDYNVEVSNTVKKLNILAIPEDEKAKVEIEKIDELKEGDNLVKINVIAQNGIIKKVYEIKVYRRNQEEEAIYIEEQEENQKKLNEIYNAERVSSQIDDDKLVQKSNRKFNIIAIVFGICIMIGIAIYLITKS